MKITVLRCTGAVEVHEVHRNAALSAIARLIEAKWLDSVNLRDGRVMFVDDLGHETVAKPTATGVSLVAVRPLRPDNPRATEMYHAVCKPGTTHRIVGDVAIVVDADFG